MTNRIPTPPNARTVIVGVDTHTHVHVAVAIDSWGIRLGDHAFVADSGGYEALVTWAETHGRIEAFGIEGTGSYGAGLARAVHRAGHHVVEVNRGDRRTRRAAGKSDTIDAEVAARSLLAGQSTAIPKTADGAVEMIRQLKITRDTAMKARTTAMNTLKQIIVQAPPVLREALHDLTDHGLLTRCAGLRPGPLDTPIASAKHTLRALARRWMALAEEIALHDQHLARLTTATAPTLCEGFGVGAHTAAELLIVFGDNPDRIHSEAAFATLCGACPIPAARTCLASWSVPSSGHGFMVRSAATSADQYCPSRTQVSVSEPLGRRPRGRVSEPSPWSRSSCTVRLGRTVGRAHRPNSRSVHVHSAATRGSPHIAAPSPSHIPLACRAHQSECGRTPPARGRHHEEEPSP